MGKENGSVIMKMRITLAATALAMLLGGCTQPGYNGNRASYYGQADQDRVLETSLRARLNQYGALGPAAANVKISAQQGTVTLSGPVSSEQDRQLIDSVARHTSGVVKVIDQLQPGLAPTSMPGQPPRIYVVPPIEVRTPAGGAVVSSAPGITIQPSTSQDRFLADTVGDALRSGAVPLTANDGITATVNNSMVYLDGTVSSDAERDAIRSVLQRTAGITAVYDRLQVR
jgi:osmotically-inducible protein OsmY